MFKEEYKSLGAKIAYYRRLRGYTQEELSFKAAISASYLSRIERGAYTKGIPVSTLFKIARALDVEPYKLLRRET